MEVVVEVVCTRGRGFCEVCAAGRLQCLRIALVEILFMECNDRLIIHRERFRLRHSDNSSPKNLPSEIL